MLSRLRTGHTRVSHNMAESGTGFRRQCEDCGERNTVEHFLCNCRKFEHLRSEHEITDIPRSLANDPVKERQVINYLKEAGLFEEI